MSSPARKLASVTLAVGLVATALVAPAARAGTSTDLVSLSSTGAKANGGGSEPAVSADGRWVAFSSLAGNLAPPGPAHSNLFLRDRLRGETLMLSRGSGGASPNGNSGSPSISDDGRYVAFVSDATNLAPSPGAQQVFLYDRTDGSIRRLSANVGPGATYDYGAYPPTISADGRRVVYTAAISGPSTRTDAFVVDVASGSVRRIGEASPGIAANGSNYSVALSGDGRWSAYVTSATNLGTPDANGKYDVIAENLDTGAKERVSLATDGAEPNGDSERPALDHSGCRIVFNSLATNLVAGATLAGTKTFVRDRCAGSMEPASVDNSGTVATSSTDPPAISGDGCAVAFLTSGVFTPAPGVVAAALRDRCTGVTTRLDVSTAGDAGNGHSSSLDVSAAGGRYVAFGSAATNLSGLDGDTFVDAYVRDRGNNTAPKAVLSVTQSAGRVTVDASGSSDPDGFSLTGSIGFGDGSAEVSGLRAVKEYSRTGTYTVSLAVTDADGATARTIQAVTISSLSPSGSGGSGGSGGGSERGGAGGPSVRLTGVRLSRKRFAIASSGGKARGNQGATLRFTLSEPGRLSLAFQRKASGRRKGKRCVAGRKTGKRCTIYKTVGTVRRTVKAGDNELALTGRVNGRSLARGAHRLRMSVRTPDGRSSKTLILTFTIVKARS